MANDDILTTLRREHDAVRALFKDMADTPDRAGGRRGAILDRILATLLPHAEWEAMVLYPEFEKRVDRDGQQAHAEAVEEHRAIETRVIPDLLRSEPGSAEFARRVSVFGAMVDHHATAEESGLFGIAGRAFSAQERSSMHGHYAAWKTSWPGQRAMIQVVSELRCA